MTVKSDTVEVVDEETGVKVVDATTGGDDDTKKVEESKQEETKAEDGDQEITVPPAAPRFPKACICPITNEVMQDPVVHPTDGNSYEKTAIIGRDGDELKYYPNRALKAYIDWKREQYEEATDGSLRGAFKRIDTSIRSGWQQILEKSALPSGEYRPLPQELYCPITFDLVYDPVIDPDGHTFTGGAIQTWIAANHDSPVTRRALTVEELYPNHAVHELLLEESSDETKNTSGSVHPSLRRWNQEKSQRQSWSGDAEAPPQPPTATPQASFPTNHDELEARHRQMQTRKNLTALGLLIACLVIFFFFPAYFTYFLLFVFCLSFLCKVQRTRAGM